MSQFFAPEPDRKIDLVAFGERVKAMSNDQLEANHDRAIMLLNIYGNSLLPNHGPMSKLLWTEIASRGGPLE